jgi:hypothetical protein
VITIGTPHRGSVNAVDSLSNGPGQPFAMLTDLARTFTSIYQLLPIYQCIKTSEGYQRAAEIDGIPGIERHRAEEALAFHREIEAAVDAHRLDVTYRDTFRTIPIVGTRQPTYQSALFSGGKIAIRRELPGWIDGHLADGDGTVPRLSATPIELSTEYRETFVAERHAALPNHPSILQDLVERVRQMQVSGQAAIRGPDVSQVQASRPAIALELEDLYLTDQPIVLRTTYVNTLHNTAPPIATLRSIADKQIHPPQPFVPDNDGWQLVLDGLEPGLYHIEVAPGSGGPNAPQPVHDVFEVAG